MIATMMKTVVATTLATALMAPIPARAQQPAPEAASAEVQQTQPAGSLSTAELEELVGPIALYPDPLLANVLAAAVYPEEVQKAARFVREDGNPKYIDNLDWEPPVKAIAKIPDVAKMMGRYLPWTTALGQAYLTQADALMAAIQTLRKKAEANGALGTTSEQTVTVVEEIVYIEPANPDVLYVPYYDPGYVYWYDDDDDELAAGLIGFGAGIIVGAIWGDLDCDWEHGCIGWGWGHADIDIDRGEINIDRDRVDHRGRVGREGAAWSPNGEKQLATARPDQLPRFKAPESGERRPAVRSADLPPRSSAATAAARPGRGARAGRTLDVPSSRDPGYRIPPSQRAESAFRGWEDTRAASRRGSSSRQSASRSSGVRRAPARGGGGGGRRGGRR